MSIPELFTCPISLDLLTDPVTLCTGQTYDRPFIQKWLAAGNLTCPVTMQKLSDPSLVPNHTLRHVIERWLDAGRQFQPQCLCPGSSLAESKLTLESKDSNLEQKLQAVKRVRTLVEEDDLLTHQNRHILSHSGIFESLMEQVFGPRREYSQGFVEEALGCAVELMPFVSSDLGCLSCMLEKEPHLGSFTVLLEKGSALMKIRLCQLVEAMAVSSSSSSSSDSSPLSAAAVEVLMEAVSIIRGLINLVDVQDLEVSGAGIKAISGLCMARSRPEILVQEGAVDALIAYIVRAERTGEKNCSGLAMRAIDQLITLDETVAGGKESLMRNPNGVKALVKMVFRVSDHQGSESAVNCLMSLCCESNKAREEAIGLGVLTQLLLLLQSQCSGRSKTKARMLLKMLRSMWGKEKDPKPCVRF
ncbi:hypothetical protein Dimus_017684 [Dionaea muscipula]